MVFTKDLLLIAAIVGGGYLILKTTGVGAIAGGAGEAAEGLGAGIGAAGRGLGGGVATAGEAAGIGVKDILGILALLRPVGAVGEAGVGVVERWTASQEREAGQTAEIDIAAFELEKQEIARIQAEQERKAAEEKAERSRLIEEEKTQYIEFATTFPEKFAAGLSYLWQYSPTGLLTSWIHGIVSVEEEAAPQQSAPEVTGAAAPTSTEAAAPTADGGVSYIKEPKLADVPLDGSRYYTPISEILHYTPLPEPEPEPTFIQKISGIFKALRGNIFGL